MVVLSLFAFKLEALEKVFKALVTQLYSWLKLVKYEFYKV